MHKKAEKMIEKLCEEMEGVGLDNISDEDLARAKAYSTIANNMAQIDYNVKIIDAMEKSEYGEDYDENGPLEDRKFYNSRRYANGRYAPKGRGSYRGYNGRMTPEIYRDMDRDYGRMYYTEASEIPDVANEMRESYDAGRGGNYWENRNYTDGMSNGGSNRNMNMRDYREGRSGMSRKRYFESKDMHKSNTPEDKQAKMKELEKHLKDMKSDLVEIKADATPEEKAIMETHLTKMLEEVRK